jgi:hypothetical protein
VVDFSLEKKTGLGSLKYHIGLKIPIRHKTTLAYFAGALVTKKTVL